jgi:hypothetical protein
MQVHVIGTKGVIALGDELSEFVIPGRDEVASLESIRPQELRLDGFRALASRAPE